MHDVVHLHDIEILQIHLHDIDILEIRLHDIYLYITIHSARLLLVSATFARGVFGRAIVFSIMKESIGVAW